MANVPERTTPDAQSKTAAAPDTAPHPKVAEVIALEQKEMLGGKSTKEYAQVRRICHCLALLLATLAFVKTGPELVIRCLTGNAVDLSYAYSVAPSAKPA